MRLSPKRLHDLYRQMDPNVYESEREGRDRTARTHLRIVQHCVKSGSLLDVGCASGVFLLQAATAGWDVTGIEPNERLCEQARQNLNGKGEVLAATLESVHFDDRFHAITLWDVLEHVPDPVSCLRACRELLEPDGCLFLNVPDIDSLQSRLLGSRWPLLLPEHLNYFNRHSLRVCMEQAGFRPLRFGRRRAWFSMKYLAYRVMQHGVPGAKILHACTRGHAGKMVVPLSLGETYAVCKIM
ncbi:MAG: class I SAM-dependent methyltransferase [Candidatus Acidiferrum sp.]